MSFLKMHTSELKTQTVHENAYFKMYLYESFLKRDDFLHKMPAKFKSGSSYKLYLNKDPSTDQKLDTFFKKWLLLKLKMFLLFCQLR